MKRISSIVACATLALGCSQAAAQVLRKAEPPAEFPPASYQAGQYVDSRGCVYIRAGISGNVTWVPRVDRRRRQICGNKPSLTPQQIEEARRAGRPGGGNDNSGSVEITIEPEDRG